MVGASIAALAGKCSAHARGASSGEGDAAQSWAAFSTVSITTVSICVWQPLKQTTTSFGLLVTRPQGVRFITCEQRIIAALIGARRSAGLGGEGVFAAFVHGGTVFLELATDCVVPEGPEAPVGALWVPPQAETPAKRRRAERGKRRLKGSADRGASCRGRQMTQSPRRGIRSLTLMSNAVMAAPRRLRARSWGLAVVAPIVLFACPARAVDAADPGAAVKDAYAELSALLYAPPSDARDIEIAAIIGRDTDFDELTRRAFGEPCPRPSCVDHWAALSSAERIEVRALFEAATTQEWTRELARAFAYDVEIQRPVFKDRDARVRVALRQKGSTDPSKGLELFLTKTPPFKLIDLEMARVQFTRNQYKQMDRTLTNPSEGYRGLVARLKKKTERDASVPEAGAWPSEPDDVEPELDAAPSGPALDAAPGEPPPLAPAPSSPSSTELPWVKIALGAALVFGIGVGLGRARGKAGPKP
jgi:hypothetical protein